MPRGGEEGNHRDDSNRHGRGTDPHLRGNGRDRHRTLGTDALLDRDIIDDREHRVDDMARTAEHREKPRRQRCENRDMLRIVAEELLRVLQHDRKAARCLQEAGTGHNRKDDEHDIDRRLARLIAEDERVDHKAEAADDREPKPPVPHTDNQADEKDNKAQNHFHRTIPPFYAEPHPAQL